VKVRQRAPLWAEKAGQQVAVEKGKPAADRWQPASQGGPVMVEYQCPSCGKRFTLESPAEQQKVTCPACGVQFSPPDPNQPTGQTAEGAGQVRYELTYIDPVPAAKILGITGAALGLIGALLALVLAAIGLAAMHASGFMSPMHGMGMWSYGPPRAGAAAGISFSACAAIIVAPIVNGIAWAIIAALVSILYNYLARKIGGLTLTLSRRQ